MGRRAWDRQEMGEGGRDRGLPGCLKLDSMIPFLVPAAVPITWPESQGLVVGDGGGVLMNLPELLQNAIWGVCVSLGKVCGFHDFQRIFDSERYHNVSATVKNSSRLHGVMKRWR